MAIAIFDQYLKKTMKTYVVIVPENIFICLYGILVLQKLLRGEGSTGLNFTRHKSDKFTAVPCMQ